MIKSEADKVYNRTKCPDGRQRCLDCEHPLDKHCGGHLLGCGQDDHYRIKIVELERKIIEMSLTQMQQPQNLWGSTSAQDRKDNEDRNQRFGCSTKRNPDGSYVTGSLQWKWRIPDTIPDKFDINEAEAAILDAFIEQGGAHVWSGDGSSCAAQIVQAVWEKLEKKYANK